jgi:hypothetical protein
MPVHRPSPTSFGATYASRSVKLRPLTDVERDMVAAAIVEHIRLCNWNGERGPPWGGFAELGRG